MTPLVVVVNDYAHVNGGTSQVALSGALALARRGVEVVLFAAVGPVMPELPAAGIRVVLTGDKDLLEGNRLKAAAQGLWNAKSARLLGELLDSLDAARTVVHFHGWTKALSSSVAQAALERNFKAVCTLHDYFAACPNGAFFNYQSNEICRLAPLSLRCLAEHCDARSYSQKVWRVARQVVQGSWGGIPSRLRHFVYVSRLSRDVLKPYLPAEAALHFIPNPVQAERLPAATPARNADYISVGRLSREKGAALFAEASRREGLPAVLVGEGPERARIERIHPGARLTGWVPSASVHERLREARALVYPALTYETFGLAVLEAASHGIPSIVNRHSAAAESVRDGVTGLLFEGGDVADLARQMRRLQDDGLTASLGLAAYEAYWASPFTMEAHVDGLLDVYEKVLRD